MRAAIISMLCLIIFGTADVLGQDKSVELDVAGLRKTVQEQLFDQTPGLQPALEHLWKSNGGAEIGRAPMDAAAEALATQISSKLNYDPPKAQLTWNINGVNPNGPLTPEVAWQLLEKFFNDRTSITPDAYLTLKGNFLAGFRRAGLDILTPPEGLSMDSQQLLCMTGYLGVNTFVYSANNSFDLALKCYQRGFYQDALVLATHSARHEPSVRAFHLRGTIEMLLGLRDAAKESARKLLQASQTDAGLFGAAKALERINNPSAVQFRLLVDEFRNT